MLRPHQTDLPQTKSAAEIFSSTYAHGASRTLPQRATDARDAWEEAALLGEPTATAAVEAAKKAAGSLEKKQREATIFSSDVAEKGECSNFAARAQAAALKDGFPGSLPTGPSPVKNRRRRDVFDFGAACDGVNGKKRPKFNRVTLLEPAQVLASPIIITSTTSGP
jgi:hypothetical protein